MLSFLVHERQLASAADASLFLNRLYPLVIVG
jgi:hypothetical protein